MSQNWKGRVCCSEQKTKPLSILNLRFYIMVICVADTLYPFECRVFCCFTKESKHKRDLSLIYCDNKMVIFSCLNITRGGELS